MSRFKYLVVALLALFLVVPFAANAQRANVATDGVGDLLLYPFFYADTATTTKISVTNTSAKYGVVAKVVLRSSLCSEELRDFIIYLSPNDVWTGTIQVEGGKVVLKSTDESVVFNGKSASDSNPFVTSLRLPKNPADTNQFGYLEVITLAYVNFGYKSSNGFTFKALMNLNGFSNVHEFMYYLYQPTTPGCYQTALSYNGACLGLDNDPFTGIICPADSSYGECAYVPVSLEDGVLFGFAEVNIPGAYAAYRALAVKDFVRLGDAAWQGKTYKILASLDTPLNLAGDVNELDRALLKMQVYFPYYDPDDADGCGSFAMLFFPTMQSKYGYNFLAGAKTCLPTKNSSLIWQAIWKQVLTGSVGIKVFSYDNSEHGVACELSPCVLKPYELYTIGPVEDIFDPFAWSEGWMKLCMSNVGYNGLIPGTNTTLEFIGLPVVPFAGHWNNNGVTFIDPPYMKSDIYNIQ